MTMLDLMGAGVRLLGVWLLVQAVGTCLSAVGMLVALDNQAPMGSATGSWLMVAVFGVVAGFVAFLFLRFPVGIARLLVPKRGDAAPDISAGMDELQTLGFALLGAYLLADTLPALVQQGVFYFELGRDHWEGMADARQLDVATTILALLIEAAIAAYLLLGARGLTRFLGRIRRAGVASEGHRPPR